MQTEIQLQRVESFRTVYALCDVSPRTRRLKATHYVCCLVHGRSPLWGIFNADGRLIFFMGSRGEIESHPAYQRKAWRVKSAAMTMTRVVEALSHEEKVGHLRKQRHRADSNVIPLPKRGAA